MRGINYSMRDTVATNKEHGRHIVGLEERSAGQSPGAHDDRLQLRTLPGES